MHTAFLCSKAERTVHQRNNELNFAAVSFASVFSSQLMLNLWFNAKHAESSEISKRREAYWMHTPYPCAPTWVSLIHVVCFGAYPLVILILFLRHFGLGGLNRVRHFNVERTIHVLCSSAVDAAVYAFSSKCKQVACAKGNKGMSIFMSLWSTVKVQERFLRHWALSMRERNFPKKKGIVLPRHLPGLAMSIALHAFHLVPSHFRWSACRNEQFGFFYLMAEIIPARFGARASPVLKTFHISYNSIEFNFSDTLLWRMFLCSGRIQWQSLESTHRWIYSGMNLHLNHADVCSECFHIECQNYHFYPLPA